MPWSRVDYEALVFGEPFLFFVLAFAVLTIINKRANWLFLRNILGIGFPEGGGSEAEEKGDKNKSSDGFNTYLFTDFEEKQRDESTRLSNIQRFLSDALASTILAIFFTIICNALIISAETVQADGKCPFSNAECFEGNRSHSSSTFNCTKDGLTNLPSTSKTWWCVGWIYKDKGIKDVLDTLGICGGLLGLISSIVPLVYYISYYKNCVCSLSVTWIIPCIPPAVLGYVAWDTHPAGPSVLTLILLSVLITMVCVGWSWAARRSCDPKTCSELRCPINNCFGQCSLTLIGCKECCEQYDCSMLNGKSKSYPWCCCTSRATQNISCCYTVCRENSFCYNKCKKCLDFCCQNEYDKYNKKEKQSIPSPAYTAVQPYSQPTAVHKAICVQPQPSKKKLPP
jgi:hypothetical protein